MCNRTKQADGSRLNGSTLDGSGSPDRAAALSIPFYFRNSGPRNRCRRPAPSARGPLAPTVRVDARSTQGAIAIADRLSREVLLAGARNGCGDVQPQEADGWVGSKSVYFRPLRVARPRRRISIPFYFRNTRSRNRRRQPASRAPGAFAPTLRVDLRSSRGATADRLRAQTALVRTPGLSPVLIIRDSAGSSTPSRGRLTDRRHRRVTSATRRRGSTGRRQQCSAPARKIALLVTADACRRMKDADAIHKRRECSHVMRPIYTATNTIYTRRT
jgi:hypothetical protein